MAKSMRSKREKRLRAMRREIVEPFYEKKDEAKQAAMAAALAAPKLPVFSSATSTSMDINTAPSTSMDVEMGDDRKSTGFLKARSKSIGKKSKGKGRGKKVFKLRKLKSRFA